MRALLVGAAIATVTLAGLSSTASATAPQKTTIAGTVTQFGGPTEFQGTWQSSGAISDSGSFVETELHLPQAFEHSPVAVVFQTVSVFSGANGTFTIAQQSVSSTGFPAGTWEVQSGTGAYEHLGGHGAFAFSPPNSLTFTGVMSKAG